LLKQPHELLVTLLVGITVVNIGASALAAAIAERLLGPLGSPSPSRAMVFLLSVFGEVLPMTVAVEHPERVSALGDRPVAWLSLALAPVRAASAG
jgi:Mg2+/Co2+ transporter CorB